MSPSLSPDDVFRLHPKIRWTAYSTDSGEVIFSQMRQGVKSYTSNAHDRDFMQLGPLIMSGIAERLTPEEIAGKLESVIVNLEKDSILLMKHGKGHLAISVDKEDAFLVFKEITPQVQQRLPT